MVTRATKDKFPLWLHPRGGWTKKIRGKLFYFGKNKDSALTEYVRVRHDLEAGRKPRPKSDSATVADVVNAFLTAKRERVESGELSSRMWSEYHRTGERIVDAFGRTRQVDDLRPEDFGQLRSKSAKRLGTFALSKVIQMTRTVFHFAYQSELIERPIRYGDLFDKPPRRVQRLERSKRSAKLIDAATARVLIDGADVQLRGMILLGLNCGFGQTDCSGLDRATLAARPGWIDTPRNKTGIDRRCPLWAETVAALEAVRAIRPNAREDADDDAVFLTGQGCRWVRWIDAGEAKRGSRKDSASPAFRKLVESLGATVPGALYTLRHTFRTVADEVRDKIAIDLIMGHADESMAATYRESVADERLEAVANHVRKWLQAAEVSKAVG